MSPTLPWNATGLQQAHQPPWPGLRVQVQGSVGSTNTVLLDRIRQGDTAPVLLVAEAQTAGRGRAGRAWHALPGHSLTFSLAVPLLRTDWSGLSLAVGLAVAEALDDDAPAQAPRLWLKWPNDLLLAAPAAATPQASRASARKMGGILIESLAAAGQRMAVIGIGLNIGADGAGLAQPPLSQGHAGLRSLRPELTAPLALARLLGPLLEMLLEFQRHGFAPLQARFARRDLLAGQAVCTTTPEWPQGLAEGVDADGALCLRVGEQRHRVTSGEVSVRPLTAADHSLEVGATGEMDAC